MLSVEAAQVKDVSESVVAGAVSAGRPGAVGARVSSTDCAAVSVAAVAVHAELPTVVLVVICAVSSEPSLAVS